MDIELMRRALELAARGVGRVSPSPLVGCVIASAAGEVLGEGTYLYENLLHAERIALDEAGTRSRGTTAYVSLEPHAHQGRTPPCTDALIDAGIVRVVAAIEDPNPLVSGKGFAALRAAGVQTEVGLLADEAARLNEKYIWNMRTGLPFVHLKMAATLDGKIATRTGDSYWITGEAARARVHELRHEYDAILIGAGTAIKDNPRLTDRSGRARRRLLVRVVLDERLGLSPTSQLAQTAHETPVLVFTRAALDSPEVAALSNCGVAFTNEADGGRDLRGVLQVLAERQLQSVFVEGGASIAGAFCDARLVNKFSFFYAPKIVGGKDAPGLIAGAGVERITDALELTEVTFTLHGADWEITGYPKNKSKVQSPKSKVGEEFKVQGSKFKVANSAFQAQISNSQDLTPKIKDQRSKIENRSSEFIKAKKSFGQNFLADENIARKIVDALAPRAGETMIEIGAGQGALTARLLESGARIIAVELDRDLLPTLQAQFGARENFELIAADALTVDFAGLIKPAETARVVANLPYYISTLILQRLITQGAMFSDMVLMLQREVVARITARAGEHERGFLSVLIEAFATAQPLFDVAPTAFRPVPKVWSTVVRLQPREPALIERQDEKMFRALVGAGFAQKRKTLNNNLRHAPPDLKKVIEKMGGTDALLNAAEIEGTRRAETLSLDEWLRLLQALI